MLQRQQQRTPIHLEQKELEWLVARTDGFTGAAVRGLCTQAAQLAAHEAIQQRLAALEQGGVVPGEVKPLRTTYQHFERSLEAAEEKQRLIAP